MKVPALFTWVIGVSTEVIGLEVEVTGIGNAPSGRIKCKLLPMSMTVVPKGIRFTAVE